MKAQLNYASGWVMTFPKHSLGPMLFMEWLQNNPRHPRDFRIESHASEEDVLDDHFVIRWKSGSKESITDCFEYIKGNLI